MTYTLIFILSDTMNVCVHIYSPVINQKKQIISLNMPFSSRIYFTNTRHRAVKCEKLFKVKNYIKRRRKIIAPGGYKTNEGDRLVNYTV